MGAGTVKNNGGRGKPILLRYRLTYGFNHAVRCGQKYHIGAAGDLPRLIGGLRNTADIRQSLGGRPVKAGNSDNRMTLVSKCFCQGRAHPAAADNTNRRFHSASLFQVEFKRCLCRLRRLLLAALVSS